MRKIELEVPVKKFGDFVDKLSERGFNTRLLSKNERNEIKVDVYFNKRDAAAIDELEEYVQDLRDDLQNKVKKKK